MIDFFIAIIFGVVQGITEFLPISSSGHLVILHEIFPLFMSNELLFDVFLHLASLFAIFVFFRKDIWQFITAWLKSLKGEKSADSKIAWYIIWSTIPAGVSGFFFDDLIEQKLHSLWVVIIMLVLIAFVFIFVEKKSTGAKSLKEMNLKEAIFIGFAQALALIPGTSRSGITIIAGLVKNFNRVDAIRFSFLLSIPIVLGANVKKFPEIFAMNFTQTEIILSFISFLACFVSAFLTIKFFIKYSQTNSFKVFAYYRIALALILIFWFFVL